LQRLGYKNITLEQCKKFVRQLPSYYRYRRARTKIKRNPILANFAGHVVQIDLADFVRNVEENNDYRYVFVSTDTYSKWLTCTPLKNKNTNSIIQVLQDLIDELPFRIVCIYSDRESGLMAKKCRAFLKSNNIILYNTTSKVKAGQAENSIRNLRLAIGRYFELTKSKRWLEYINDYVSNYNNTIHSTTKRTPLEVVSDPTILIHEPGIKPYVPRKDKKTNLPPINSLVRVSKVRSNFEKESTGTWSNEVFKVVSHKLGQQIPMVTLEALDGEPIYGNFYEKELYPVPINSYQHVLAQ